VETAREAGASRSCGVEITRQRPINRRHASWLLDSNWCGFAWRQTRVSAS